MILSQSCQIAIKSLAHICSSDAGCVNVKNLAEITGENAHTIAKVLQSLVKRGYLSSATGPHGGFYLTKDQLQIQLSEIVQSIEGVNVFGKCILGLDDCSAKHPCPVHNKYAPLRKDIAKIFEEIPLTQLARVIENGDVFLK